jgi:signal peptidase I
VQDYQAPARLHTPAERRAHLMRELVEVVLFVGIVFVIVQFAIKPYRVTGSNMQPQLTPNQIIVVNRTSYIFSGPGRGDVVVYTSPANTLQQLIGRVIAVPGDTLAINATQVILNGVVLNETYAPQVTGSSNTIVQPVKLANGQYFIMNDGRGAGGDSRNFGPVARSNIVGRAAIVFWPLSDFGGVSTFASVFKDVP